MEEIIPILVESIELLLFIIFCVVCIYAFLRYLRTGRLPFVSMLPDMVQVLLLRLFAVSLLVLVSSALYGILYSYVGLFMQYVFTDPAFFGGVDTDMASVLSLVVVSIFFWGCLEYLSFAFRSSAISPLINRCVNATKKVFGYIAGVCAAVGLAGYAVYLVYRASFTVPLIDVAIATSIGTLLVLSVYAGVRIVHGHNTSRLGVTSYSTDWIMAIIVALLLFLFGGTIVLIFSYLSGGDRMSVYGTMLVFVVLVYLVYAYKYIESHTPIVSTAHAWAEKHPLRLALVIPSVIVAIVLLLGTAESISQYLFFALCACIMAGVVYATWKAMLDEHKAESVPELVTTTVTRFLDVLEEDYGIKPFVYETTYEYHSITILMNVFSSHDRDRLEEWLADELCTKLGLKHIEITDCDDTSYGIEPIHTLCYVRLVVR